MGQGGADFVYVGAVGPDGFVEDLAGDVELFGPVGDVGGHFWVDLFGVVRALGMVFVRGVEFVGFGCVVVLGHAGFLFPVLLVCLMRIRGGRCTGRSDSFALGRNLARRRVSRDTSYPRPEGYLFR